MRTLFPREQVVGIFRGFSGGGLEFHADLVLPYRSEFQSIPIHGQFVLVQLESDAEAVLGRITSISSEGRLVSGSGEEYGLRVVSEDREIPEDLRNQYLRYRVNIRVLGVVRLVNEHVVFAASHRRLPHVGSRVAFVSDELLAEIVGGTGDGVELGFFALGEFIFAGDDRRLRPSEWMRVQPVPVLPRFNVQQLVSRRTFVFARAGFGKSNLNKLLFSALYRSTPTVEKRGGRRIPVGTVIFDPDGEYFWPDDKNRPGLCDVPELEDQLVVFTNRAAPSAFYGSFVAGSVKLDIRRLRPSDVVTIALPEEKQAQQNVAKLRQMNLHDWQELVNLIHQDRNGAELEQVKRLLKLEAGQDAEALAARGNMTQIVQMLHDPSSQLLELLLKALGDGKLCVVDVSQMRGTPALVLSGLILRKIFDTNQQEFTQREPHTIPTIAVLEEAQSVLGSRRTATSGEGPYVEWVKEGRKYDLGAVLITQQPGSISPEILSQGDTWFVFHLLSEGDLKAVRSANAHFSEDLLSSLLNEPIPGHAVFWSSSGSRPYPVSVRILDFEALHPVRDLHGTLGAHETYARKLARAFEEELTQRLAKTQPVTTDGIVPRTTFGERRDEDQDREVIEPATAGRPDPAPDEPDPSGSRAEQLDSLEVYQDAAIRECLDDTEFMDALQRGMFWWDVQLRLINALPSLIPFQERFNMAYPLVLRLLERVFGPQDQGWHKELRRNKRNQMRSWIVPGRAPTDRGNGVP